MLARDDSERVRKLDSGVLADDESEDELVEVRSHEHKRVDFTLYRIGEAEGRSLAEADENNIAAPGQVQIGRPKF